MAEHSIGKITQIIGAVLDIKFADGNLPEINDAIRITRKDGSTLVVEVAQHLGDDTVRCISMGPTDGLVRGMEAIATGGPITVPVGEKTLGRIFNVLGIIKKLHRLKNTCRFIENHLLLKICLMSRKSLKQVSKSLTYFALIRRVVRSVCSVVPV